MVKVYFACCVAQLQPGIREQLRYCCIALGKRVGILEAEFIYFVCNGLL